MGLEIENTLHSYAIPKITPNKQKFEDWSQYSGDYAEYSPKHIQGELKLDNRKVEVDIIVGLMNTFHTTGDYGFYIYCNERLAVKDSKDEHLGFNGSDFSYPHNRLAKFRCEVRLNGPRYLMPWNSTKSGLNFNHPVITQIIEGLKRLAKPYLNFSSKLMEYDFSIIDKNFAVIRYSS